MTADDEPRRLLDALRQAGSCCFLSEGQFFCSPPRRPVDWPGDVETDIVEHEDALAALVAAELGSALVH